MNAKNIKMKNYFADLVQQEFLVPQPNLHWYIDYSEIVIDPKKKIYFLILIDGCYNQIIKTNVAINKPISVTDTVRRIESALKERRIPEQLEKIEPDFIIHSDRGSQFTSFDPILIKLITKKHFLIQSYGFGSITYNQILTQ